jgi:hypothetical protein
MRLKPTPTAPNEARVALDALAPVLAERWGVREGSTHVWFELGPR